MAAWCGVRGGAAVAPPVAARWSGACEKGGQWQPAPPLICEMRLVKLEPAIVMSYNTKGEPLHQARPLHGEMWVPKLVPAITSYSAIRALNLESIIVSYGTRLHSQEQQGEKGRQCRTCAKRQQCEKGDPQQQCEKGDPRQQWSPDVISYSGGLREWGAEAGGGHHKLQSHVRTVAGRAVDAGTAVEESRTVELREEATLAAKYIRADAISYRSALVALVKGATSALVLLFQALLLLSILPTR